MSLTPPPRVFTLYPFPSKLDGVQTLLSAEEISDATQGSSPSLWNKLMEGPQVLSQRGVESSSSTP